MLNLFINVLLVIHVILCLLIAVAVLMQRPKNEGLGAAFGGGMTESLFGAQTTNVLATITRWLVFGFFVITLTLSALYARQGRLTTGVQQKLKDSPRPPESKEAPATATPAADPAGPGAAVVPQSQGDEGAKKVDAPTAPKPDVPQPVAPAPDLPKNAEPIKNPSESKDSAAPEKKESSAPEGGQSDAGKSPAPPLKVSAPELNPGGVPSQEGQKPAEQPQ
ncbi:MAG: preprotein translocase subunit SecG [Verrucomicrobiota bacterium]|jgi:preprotein translocase subunit SecG